MPLRQYSLICSSVRIIRNRELLITEGDKKKSGLTGLATPSAIEGHDIADTKPGINHLNIAGREKSYSIAGNIHSEDFF